MWVTRSAHLHAGHSPSSKAVSIVCYLRFVGLRRAAIGRLYLLDRLDLNVVAMWVGIEVWLRIHTNSGQK